MVREAPAMTVRQNLGELFNEIQYRHDSVLITKLGKPIAALVNIDLFNRIRLLGKEFERLTNDLANACSDTAPGTAEAEIAEAIEAAHHK